MIPEIRNRPFFCSWSGGKDSCLALYHAVRSGGRPRCLLTVLTEDGLTSRSHGLPRSLIEEQARRLGVPALFCSASWGEYEGAFVSALRKVSEDGVEIGVFGDIDVDAHREWVKGVCVMTGITPIHPLWKRDRSELLDEFISLGFRASIVVLKEDRLGVEFLGKTIDGETLAELERAGVDASGELGEYHTVVTAGPMFSSAISLTTKGQVRHKGYRLLKVESTADRLPGRSGGGGKRRR